MGGGTDDEAHGPTGPVLWGRGGSGHKEGIRIVLGGRGEGGRVPFPEPAKTHEVVFVKLCREARVGGDGEVVEYVANDARVFLWGDCTGGEGMGEGMLECRMNIVETGEVCG